MSDRPYRMLAGPWGLPAPLEEKLGEFIENDDPEAVAMLLGDEAAQPGRDPRLLAVLAHAQLELARTRVGLEQALPLLAEAVEHLDQAVARGADAQALSPLRADLEKVLDTATRRELALVEAMQNDPAGASDEVLEDGAWVMEKRDPAQAALLFERLADRQKDKGFEMRVRGALARHAAGDKATARPVLEQALDYDWRQAGVWEGRFVTEAAFLALMEDAVEARDEEAFRTLWNKALERMDALGARFPAVWPNQTRLLELCLLLGDGDRARFVTRRMRDARPWIPRALEARMTAAAQLQ